MEVDEFLFYSQFMLFPSQESPISEEEKAPPPIKRIDDAKFDKISGIVSTICYILNNTQVTVKERRIIDIRKCVTERIYEQKLCLHKTETQTI